MLDVYDESKAVALFLIQLCLCEYITVTMITFVNGVRTLRCPSVSSKAERIPAPEGGEGKR